VGGGIKGQNDYFGEVRWASSAGCRSRGNQLRSFAYASASGAGTKKRIGGDASPQKWCWEGLSEGVRAELHPLGNPVLVLLLRQLAYPLELGILDSALMPGSSRSSQPSADHGQRITVRHSCSMNESPA